MPTLGRVVVAPDKFKGSLTAAQVSAVVAEAVRAADPSAEVRELPIADGGDGTVALAVSAGLTPMPLIVSGPLGRPVEAVYAIGADEAVVEMAAAAGMGLVDGEPDVATALAADTAGVGQLLVDAIDGGARRIVLGLGGSATTDGGLGLARALGAVVSGSTIEGGPVPSGGAGLASVTEVDPGPMIERLAGVEVVLATDVDNPAVGPPGAAAVYGPQKGADVDAVARLDRHLGHWADVLAAATGVDVRHRPGAGAAGGTGMPLLATGCATVAPGIDVVMDLAGLGAVVQKADVVIVGEGSLDGQSLRGKGPVGVARAARAAGAEVLAVAGVNTLSADQLAEAAIDRAYALVDLEPDPEVCMAAAEPILRELATLLATEGLARRA
ncbi:MAG: glycerate kinase [Actinomycetota bacterium]